MLFVRSLSAVVRGCMLLLIVVRRCPLLFVVCLLLFGARSLCSLLVVVHCCILLFLFDCGCFLNLLLVVCWLFVDVCCLLLDWRLSLFVVRRALSLVVVCC